MSECALNDGAALTSAARRGVGGVNMQKGTAACRRQKGTG